MLVGQVAGRLPSCPSGDCADDDAYETGDADAYRLGDAVEEMACADPALSPCAPWVDYAVTSGEPAEDRPYVGPV